MDRQRIDVYHHIVVGAEAHSSDTLAAKLDEILLQLHSISERETNIMATLATLDTILAKVTEQTTITNGVVVLITGLRQQILDAGTAAGLSPEVLAKFDAILATVDSNSAVLSSALTANVPAPV
jgi:hypothetical protein